MMDESWLAVPDAARELGVSQRHARDLLESGALRGRKVGQSWLIDPQDVQRRAAHGKQPGRPLSPSNAWRCLVLLEPCARESGIGASPSAAAPAKPPASRWQILLEVPFQASPVDRSRLRSLLADLPGPDGFARLVKSRANIRRVRAHPGVLDRALADKAVSGGGGHAVAALGGGVAAGGRHRVYVPADGSDAYLGRYRLADDVEGNIDVAIIPPDVDPQLRPQPGEFVPLPVAWADLLDDPDSRARNAARAWVRGLPRSLSIADGRRR